MQKIVKDILKCIPVVIFLFVALHLLGALLLYKNGFDFNSYYYFSFAIHIFDAGIIAFIFHGSVCKNIAVLPLFLTDIILIALFRSFHLKTALLIVAYLILYYLIILVLNKRKNVKKRNINTIRRDYEKIRKKQHYKH